MTERPRKRQRSESYDDNGDIAGRLVDTKMYVSLLFET